MAAESSVAARPPALGGAVGAVSWVVVSIAAFAVPLTIGPTDIDAFRLPKDLLYEALAAVCAALFGIALLYRRAEVVALLRRHAAESAVVVAALAWTALTTLTSTNRTLSLLSLIWVASAATIFLLTLVVAGRGTGMMILAGAFVAAGLNAVLALLQRFDVYNPLVFPGGLAARMKTTGLIGNPNDVGTYLLFPALAAAAAALASRGVRAAVFAAIAVLLAAGIAATATLTALVAFFLAAMVLLCLRTGRVVASSSAAAVLCVLLFVTVPPLRQRAAEFARNARAGNYVQLLSLRVPAYAVAIEMFKDHPLVGVGPGCFGWWYFPYKTALNERHPTFGVSIENFGEAHNDHLQTLAVSGAPGYAIFAAAVVLLGRVSFKRKGAQTSEREAFSRLASLTLAVAFAVVAMAQFPLELAATTGVLIHLAAVCTAWKDA